MPYKAHTSNCDKLRIAMATLDCDLSQGASDGGCAGDKKLWVALKGIFASVISHMGSSRKPTVF